MIRNPADPVTEAVPANWKSIQERIAKDALGVLCKHYPGYKWGVEWPEADQGRLGIFIIRALDIPTQICGTIHPKHLIDDPNLKMVIRIGGLFLEALGLPTTKARAGADRVRGLITTPNGLIVPDHAALPDNNPGYDTIKRMNADFGRSTS